MASFPGLVFLPLCDRRLRVGLRGTICVDVRVPSNHLIGDALSDIVQVEDPLFTVDL